MLKKIITLSCLTLATAFCTISLPAAAQSFGFYINSEPPQPRYEVIPQARRGYTWNEGHWEWRARRHIWIKGNWIKNRQGYTYQQPRWEQRDRDQRWALQRGQWNRSQTEQQREEMNRREEPQRRGGRRY